MIHRVTNRGRAAAGCIAIAVLAACDRDGPSRQTSVPDSSATRLVPDSSATRLVMLGTGTPNADPDRSGPSLAIVTGGKAYLVDAGAGVVRRAAAAARAGVGALRADRLDLVFLTHLHSDHTLGLPDLIFTPWVLERPDPLVVYGPHGTRDMVDHILRAWSRDIDIRLHGGEPRHNVDAWRAVVHETETPGLIYEDSLVRVYAIPVHHGAWREAYGYRFVTADRTIVVSGDESPRGTAIADACNGCDILVHEAYTVAKFAGRSGEWQRYHADAHTSTKQLAALATRAHPGLLVLYHQLLWGATPADFIREIHEAGYDGRVVSANDLDVF